MTHNEKKYYRNMAIMGRLLPLRVGDRLGGFITFYIGDDDEKYIRNNPWILLDDDPEGTIAYIDQLITDKHLSNPKLSLEVWRYIKGFFKNNYPNVKCIKWVRGGKRRTYELYS